MMFILHSITIYVLNGRLGYEIKTNFNNNIDFDYFSVNIIYEYFWKLYVCTKNELGN